MNLENLESKLLSLISNKDSYKIAPWSNTNGILLQYENNGIKDISGDIQIQFEGNTIKFNIPGEYYNINDLPKSIKYRTIADLLDTDSSQIGKCNKSKFIDIINEFRKSGN